MIGNLVSVIKIAVDRQLTKCTTTHKAIMQILMEKAEQRASIKTMNKTT